MALLRKSSGRPGRPPKPVPDRVVEAVEGRDRSRDEYQFISIHAICARIDLSRSQVLRMVAAGAFPQPVEVSRKRRAWLKSEVYDWMDAKVRGRESGPR